MSYSILRRSLSASDDSGGGSDGGGGGGGGSTDPVAVICARMFSDPYAIQKCIDAANAFGPYSKDPSPEVSVPKQPSPYPDNSPYSPSNPTPSDPGGYNKSEGTISQPSSGGSGGGSSPGFYPVASQSKSGASQASMSNTALIAGAVIGVAVLVALL